MDQECLYVNDGEDGEILQINLEWDLDMILDPEMGLEDPRLEEVE